MEALKIQFTHPVKGRIRLRKKEAKKVKTFKFRSNEDFSVEISIKGLNDGNWTASLEWVHDKQLFLVEKHFRIVDKEMAALISN